LWIELGKRHISITINILGAHNFRKREMWMVAQVVDDCSASKKLGVSTLQGKLGFPNGMKLGDSNKLN
jgi:hypothetical protein